MQMLLLMCLLFLLKYVPVSAQAPSSSIVILGNLSAEQKSLFAQTIQDEIHAHAHSISTQNPSYIYVYPYELQMGWQVISLHVQGSHHHEKILSLNLERAPLENLNDVRSVVGLDQSLKFIGWSTYADLPREKILIASKIIAQDHLYLSF